MTFSEKLKQAMQELHLNQRQVCGMTGKSKGSVSQYLSGKQIPSDDVQSAIAVALGLESDYFSKSDEQVVVLPTAELRNGVIPRLDVEKAAKLLQMNHNTVRKGLQQGVFPWGYGIHTSDKGHTNCDNGKCTICFEFIDCTPSPVIKSFISVHNYTHLLTMQIVGKIGKCCSPISCTI